jgi:hypothetical protein
VAWVPLLPRSDSSSQPTGAYLSRALLVGDVRRKCHAQGMDISHNIFSGPKTIFPSLFLAQKQFSPEFRTIVPTS